MPRLPQVIVFAGSVSDKNPRGIAGAKALGAAIAQRYPVQPLPVGETAYTFAADWVAALATSGDDLRHLAEALDRVHGEGQASILTAARCASSIATLPVIARHHADAVIVWFDAHADSNTPASSGSGYLGGMVLSGAAGLWDSGHGSGLDMGNVILVGSRDIDPFEQSLIDSGRIRHIPVGPDTAAVLKEMIKGRPVYIHLDCDVLEPGLVPTEYTVPDGLTFAGLHACMEVLADSAPVGLEIAEFEGENADNLLDYLHPLLSRLCS